MTPRRDRITLGVIGSIAIMLFLILVCSISLKLNSTPTGIFVDRKFNATGCKFLGSPSDITEIVYLDCNGRLVTELTYNVKNIDKGRKANEQN